MEIQRFPLLYTPQKRKREISDPFFNEGNIEARRHWLKRQCHNDDKYILDNFMAMVIDEEAEKLKNHTQPIICLFAPCNRLKNPFHFPTTSSYEAHYNSTHRWVCIECHAIFPAEKWLTLHLNEFHDTLRQILKERGEKIYECYVTGCEKKCSTPKMRRLHLVSKHKYPNTFNFAIVKTGIIPLRDPRRRGHKRDKSKEQSHGAHAMDVTSAEHFSIPGDAHSPSLFSEELPQTKHPSDDSGMEVDELVSSLAELKIPKTISFGRGARSQGWFGPDAGHARNHIAGADKAIYGSSKNYRKDRSSTAAKMDITIDKTSSTEAKMNRRERRKNIPRKDVDMT